MAEPRHPPGRPLAFPPLPTAPRRVPAPPRVTVDAERDQVAVGRSASVRRGLAAQQACVVHSWELQLAPQSAAVVTVRREVAHPGVVREAPLAPPPFQACPGLLASGLVQPSSLRSPVAPSPDTGRGSCWCLGPSRAPRAPLAHSLRSFFYNTGRLEANPNVTRAENTRGPGSRFPLSPQDVCTDCSLSLTRPRISRSCAEAPGMAHVS